jgi:hypothetical protein
MGDRSHPQRALAIRICELTTRAKKSSAMSLSILKGKSGRAEETSDLLQLCQQPTAFSQSFVTEKARKGLGLHAKSSSISWRPHEQNSSSDLRFGLIKKIIIFGADPPNSARITGY